MTVKKYSIIIPILNEQDNVKPLYSAIREVLELIHQTYEIIFVDDGSNDQSVFKLRQIIHAQQPSYLKVVSLNRNYGQSLALMAGLSLAQGEYIITMDGDLQNNPGDIPLLISKLDEGYDMVCGWRKNRQDPWLKKASSCFAYWIHRYIFKEPIHDVGCSLRLFKRKVIEGVNLSDGLHRFFTYIVCSRGFSVAEIIVSHHGRKHGESKYNVRNRIIPGLKWLLYLVFLGLDKAISKKASYSVKEVIS